MNHIEIWEPRYSRKDVLIAPSKVKNGWNRITFTKAKMNDLYLTGEEIRSYPLESNGKIACYAVPLVRLRKDIEERQVEFI